MKNDKDNIKDNNKASEAVSINEKTEVKKEEIAKASNDFSFIQEKIKERPINKKKLIRKMTTTAGTALVFGFVACASIFFLEPLFDKFVNRGTETDLTQVTLPEAEDGVIEELPNAYIEPSTDDENDGTVLVETPIEDMIVDSEVSENAISPIDSVQPPEYDITLDDYQLLYRQMYSLSKEVAKSVVTVTAISEDSQWYTSSAVSETTTAGAIVGDNGVDYLILVDDTNLKGASSIIVTFCDNTSAGALFIKKDNATSLAIYGVPIAAVSETTKESIQYVTIGSSISTGLLGNAVIAVGYPLGDRSSVCYGAVTSTSEVCHVTDGQYQIITTDIYGSPSASGIIVNAKGQVVGIISQQYRKEGMENMVSGYGISGIRKLIENLSNDSERCYIGLTLSDVTSLATEQFGVPQGAYVTKVDMNSPALNVGIIAGDVITRIGNNTVHGVSDYMANLAEASPEDILRITYQRPNGNEYKEMSVEVKVEELN